MSLMLYTEGDQQADLLVAQWWAEMKQDGELELMFNSPPSLGKLFKGLAPPSVTVFDVDDEGVWFVGWFEPIFSGAMFSVWIAKRARHTKRALETFRQIALSGAKDFGTLISVTKQADLLDEKLRLGYELVAEIPGFFGGETAWIMLLNEAGLAGGARLRKSA